VQKLRMLESGDRQPGQTILQKAVVAYRRPLITFYLTAPPERGERAEDFRAHAGTVSAKDNAMLDALLRDVRARQQMLREVIEDAEEAEPLTFVGSARMTQGPKQVAANIRTALGVSEEQQKRSRDTAALFALLRTAVEKIGVYVLLLGDVGSHHSDIGEDVFRGFALADDVTPFAVINDNDAAAARPFTLMHELVHIWLGASGVSGPLREVPDDVVERFCNDTASEFLLPSAEIPDHSTLLGHDIARVSRAIQGVADTWKASEPAVAYRFAQNGWIDRAAASKLFAMYADRWRREKQHERQNRRPEDSGPTFFMLRRHRLGAALLNVVRRALREETLTHTSAAKILGVGPASVSPLLQDGRSNTR
jgi:Zn-dependent peptidase ImmA (M78 family)